MCATTSDSAGFLLVRVGGAGVGGRGAYLCVACLSLLTIDHAPLSAAAVVVVVGVVVLVLVVLLVSVLVSVRSGACMAVGVGISVGVGGC